MSRDKKAPDAVVDLERSRDRLQVKRQERAEEKLAARFHDAMGWKGKPGQSTGTGKKAKRKKR